MKELVMGNLKIKILALLLAVLAWVYVHAVPYPDYFGTGFGTSERKIDLPVEYQNLHTELDLVESTAAVELVLREESHAFMPGESLRAFVDLNGVSVPGRYFLEIELQLPRWMKLINQRPKYALIIVEEVKP
jgi:YbbR domain-containing protein